MSAVDQSYKKKKPTKEPQAKDRTLLILKHESSPLYETRILIDTSRHVILAIEIFFFFQAEDGIRDPLVTGVQTCALPISLAERLALTKGRKCGITRAK